MHCPATGILPVPHHWILQYPVCRKFPVSASETTPGCMAIGIVWVLPLCCFPERVPSPGKDTLIHQEPVPGFLLSSPCLVKRLGDFEFKARFPILLVPSTAGFGLEQRKIWEEEQGGPCTGQGPFCVIFNTHTELQHKSHLCTHRQPSTCWDRPCRAA